MSRLALIAIAAVALGCAVLDLVVGPVAMTIVAALILMLEVAVGLASAAELLRAQRLVTAASRPTARAHVAGSDVTVLPITSPCAFVLGVRRPSIFVSAGLLASLADEHLQAVLAHERAHVADRAPLRLALLAGIRRVLPFDAVAELVERRAADIECQADRAAVASGVTPRALAAALLRVEPFPGGAGMAPLRAPRIAALAAMAGGAAHPAAGMVAIELLVPVALWAAIPVCLAVRFVIGGFLS